MPGIMNNLYPAVVSTYMPAFVRTTACRVYFSLSIYNSVEEIKNVQVIVNNQNTNLSALSEKLYPTGIKIANLQVDNDVVGDSKYFVTIEPEDLQSGVFELNQFYKVQLRFTGVGAAPLTDWKKIAAWLVDNQRFFSEWSRVCLIKGIEQPEIYLRNFEGMYSDERAITVFTSEVVDVVGNLYYSFNGDIEKEALKSYNIKIYKIDTNSLFYDSGEVYTNIYNPNEINYTLKTALEDGVYYRLILSYTTTNEYQSKVSYSFTVIQNTIDALKARITSELEEELGRIKINIQGITTEVFFGNITIRRTSSESNYTVWEDIHEVTISEGDVLNYTWYDYTVKSGVWYRYCAHQRNSQGHRGAVIRTRYPIIAVFDDIFLTRDKLQLRLRYDPNISSFKRTILESRTDTLGSKYPIIRRNGTVNYRQFPISGLITAFCDEEGVFINRENVFGEHLDDYNAYNEEQNITVYNDYIYEREFRERIMDFLYDNTIKLFRSTTEGNILVKLMDISFTPNQTLGRMLYSFSATAYEIDDCTLENISKYGAQPIGKANRLLSDNFLYIGQLQGTYSGTGQDVLLLLQEKYSNKATKRSTNTVKCLRWLRIEFDMPPYLINSSMEPIKPGEEAGEDSAVGYIVYINNKPVIVTQRNYYELIGEGIELTSVYFPVESKVTIDYRVEVEQTENKRLTYHKIFFYTKAGQIHDAFDINENVFLRIYQKYLSDYVAYHTELLALNKITIEATPGAVAYIRDSNDNEFFKHEIGPTGLLDFYDNETTITGIYFSGVRLYDSDPESDEIRDREFRIVEGSFNSIDEIKKPIKNGVYHINDKRYIYYMREWFEFSDNNIVQCPVNAIIDYIFESMKGEYYK